MDDLAVQTEQYLSNLTRQRQVAATSALPSPESSRITSIKQISVFPPSSREEPAQLMPSPVVVLQAPINIANTLKEQPHLENNLPAMEPSMPSDGIFNMPSAQIPNFLSLLDAVDLNVDGSPNRSSNSSSDDTTDTRSEDESEDEGLSLENRRPLQRPNQRPATNQKELTFLRPN